LKAVPESQQRSPPPYSPPQGTHFTDIFFAER